METTSITGIQYIVTKRQYENDQAFYEKCWDITKQNPSTQEEFKMAFKISQLRQNEKQLGCKYPSNVKNIYNTFNDKYKNN